MFNVTSITNEEGQLDYPYYWASTTHVSYPDQGGSAAYVAFGEALGYMNNAWIDVHGAGAQRSDPKAGNPDNWPTGHGPQGDAIRIYNYARCVRDADTTAQNIPPTAEAGGPYTGEPGSLIALNGSASTDADGSIVLYDYLGKLHRDARLERPDGGLVDGLTAQPEGEDDVDHNG